jgi:propionate CoA-transferase
MALIHRQSGIQAHGGRSMTDRCTRKLATPDEAARLVKDGDTVAFSGFVGAAHPESLSAAVERRWLLDQSPRDLTLVYAAGQGDGAKRGLNHLAHEGLIKRVIGGHWGLAPRLGELAVSGKIEAWNFPQGVICQLFRDIAAGRPGCITHVGLGTFVDPRVNGGRLNDRTPAEFIELVSLGGKEWLWYRSFPIHVAMIRATFADACGNLLTDEEAIVGEILPIAQAAHNSGGTVIAQVKGILDHRAAPQQVRVPGILVDRIVIANESEHDQTFAEKLNPAYCSAGNGEPIALPSLPYDERRIIASRACDELSPGMLANLGIGMPEGIARIAAERDLLDQVTLSVESGPIGGMPAGGLSFGASYNPQAIIDQPAQFDLYDGRALDFAALGCAQVDRFGNVNVSRFGSKLAGLGGFVNISQTAKKLVFCGTFTASGLEVELRDGCLKIAREGAKKKFIREVEQISFSAAHSRSIGQEVLFVTERAVFKLTSEGLELIEVAPGIDIQRDIIGQMEFEPVIRSPKVMASRHFAAQTP